MPDTSGAGADTVRARWFRQAMRYPDPGTGLKQCLTENDGDLDGVDVKKMEKLFLSLA